MTTVTAALLVALTFGQASPVAAPAAQGRITGRVTAEGTNAPIAGARVILFPQRPRVASFGPPAEAITDQDGRFAFDGVGSGSYNLDVQKAGYVPFPGTPGRSHPIDVAAGQTIADVNVQLAKGGIIAGRLLDAAGQPVSEVSVMALRRVAAGGSQERYLPAPGSGPGQTNDIGEFRLAGLAPGDYIVSASPRGHSPFGGPGVAPAAATAARSVPVTTYYPGSRDQSTAQTIHVAAGQTVENIVFTMLSATAYRLTGVVVDEAGAPVSGAIVSLMNDPRAGVFMGPPSGARSRDDGTFVVTGVPAGTYRVIAMLPVTISSTAGGAGGSRYTTWTSTASGGIVTGGAIVGGVTSGAAGGPVEVVVADADVADLRVIVKR